MALINHAKREINAKIVYYGCEGVGKRASLQYLYDRIKPSLRGIMKTVPASGDALLFFDFSPFEQPQFGGYRIRFHMYSLTGKVTNPAAWKMTLKGADGVVIVADASSETAPATRESILNLRGFLAAYGVGLHDIPCVLQLNSPDSRLRSSEADIAADFDVPDIQACHSVAGSGDGVLKAISLLSRDIMVRIEQDAALRVTDRPLPLVSGVDADAAPLLMDITTEERLMKPESVESVPEESALCTEKQGESGDACKRLQVALSGEAAVCVKGTLRIPLVITVGGVAHKLVVSVGIEQA